ncbi:MAG: Xaa-Pro aminopeptidase [Myxococcales bacterium]|nr:Xaa-Pro aminopeptidase [Myxococcales bacterium]MDD9970556.1 Xaa-Pro aminopeptidase [Myxococcales bacterium]
MAPQLQAEYAERRKRFLGELTDGIAIVPCAPSFIRNNDVEHEYRQDSDFYYLTGFDEPESVLVLKPGHADGEYILFVRERDPEREVWDGRRAGVDGAVTKFGAEAAYPIAEFDKRLPELLSDVRRLHYRLGQDPDFDRRVVAGVQNVRRRVRTGVVAPSEIVDSAVSLHGMRLRKSSQELSAIERAGAITRSAHLRAMQMARPGRHEFEVEAEILRVFRQSGAERPAYGSIVGSGPNATILHHRRNDRLMQEGDLVLIDAGVELDYYASDVTRTFPVSGRFSAPQRELYELVLQAQLEAIDAVKPGATMVDVHDAAVAVLTDGMVKLGLIEGPCEKAIEEGRYKPYYMHKTSHWLGMDVHDVGNYFVDKRPRPLEPGMVLTVEPGIYLAEDAEVPEAYRGIGIRIEDDIAVTADGHRNLTPNIPKSPDELEALLGARTPEGQPPPREPAPA